MGEITGKGRESLEKHLGDDSTQQSLTNFAPISVTNYRVEAGSNVRVSKTVHWTTNLFHTIQTEIRHSKFQ